MPADHKTLIRGAPRARRAGRPGAWALKLTGIAVVILMITRGAAHAEPREELTLSYFFDGGAIPWFWLPVLGSIAVDHWVEPRATPLYFDPAEGGAPRAAWENPSWTLYIGAIGLGAGMVVSGDDSRWYHVKGLAQATATSALVVSVLKPLVGRHRPDWVAGTSTGDELKSFPSGHASEAFVVATYGALYLHSRVFDDSTAGWTQGAAYGGLFLAASLVAGERIYHARHHLSDVVVGALIGSASSYATFEYQDYRFRHRGSKPSSDDARGRRQITPSFSQTSVALGWSGEF